MFSANRINQLQVGILDNGRQGSCYAFFIYATRTLPEGKEDAVKESYLNSNGFPFVTGTLAQGGVHEKTCMIKQDKGKTLADAIHDTAAYLPYESLEVVQYYRILLVPLGTDVETNILSSAQIAQINADLAQYRMNYYDFVSQPKPALKLLGKAELPNAERYCDFHGDLPYSSKEMLSFMRQRTKSMLAVSHGRPASTRFEVKMVDLVPHVQVHSVLYKKQTGEMVQLPIDAFQKKVARARHIPSFTYSGRIQISQLLADFNEGKLPPPAWVFSFGKQLSLSIQHDYSYLSQPNHPFLKDMMNPVTDIKELMPPTPPVYYAYIGGMNSYGAFADRDLNADTLIDIYAGVFADHHDHPESNNYCYRPQTPGYQYSYCQGVYAVETGNVTTLINSGTSGDKKLNTSSALVANVGAALRCYKKTPLIFYYTLTPVAKGTQLLASYDDLIQDECTRQFGFFGNGATVLVNDKTQAYYNEDIKAGQRHYAAGDYEAAKRVFKSAYYLLSASYKQLPQNQAGKIQLVFASVCEYLADTYKRVDNGNKAFKYLTQAIELRESMPVKSSDNKERLVKLAKKLDGVKTVNNKHGVM